MEHNQQQIRHAADQEFQESLDQLEQILQESTNEDEETPFVNNGSASDTPFVNTQTNVSLSAWEDAVADIEQYFESKRNRGVGNGEWGVGGK